MGLRSFAPMVTACPGCGRTTSDTFQHLAQDIQGLPARADAAWRTRYPGVETMQVAVMGCVVNGPGESKHANIGISLPGSGEHPAAPVFVDGEKVATLKGDAIAEQFKRMVDDYVGSLTADEECLPPRPATPRRRPFRRTMTSLITDLSGPRNRTG